jgi:hypothetical protein
LADAKITITSLPADFALFNVLRYRVTVILLNVHRTLRFDDGINSTPVKTLNVKFLPSPSPSIRTCTHHEKQYHYVFRQLVICHLRKRKLIDNLRSRVLARLCTHQRHNACTVNGWIDVKYVDDYYVITLSLRNKIKISCLVSVYCTRTAAADDDCFVLLI